MAAVDIRRRKGGKVMFNRGSLNRRRVAFWFSGAIIGAMLGAGPASADLLVTDFTNDVVKRYNSSTGAFISDWPGGYKYADAPRGIEFSPNGSQFFVSSTRDPKDYVLKYNASTGSYAGVLVADVAHEDLYLAPNGWLYATGYHSTQGSLYRYNPTTGSGGYLGAVPGGSSGVTMGWDGDLYISNYSANTISRYSQFGQNFGVVISGVGNSGAGGLTFGPDGHIYAVGTEGGTAGYVYKYNGWDYQFMRKYAVGAKGLTDIEFGPDGWLYVVSFDDGRVRRMSTITGAVSDFVAPGSGGLGMPWNIAFTRPAGSGTILGEPQPVGDSEVRLNVVEVLGDPGVGTTSLGSVHGLSAQSVGGIGEVTKTNTMRRNFEFKADGGGTEPLTVFLNGTLEGQLLSDNLGRAKVTAKIEIFDLDGLSLGSCSKEVSVNSLFGSQHNADVFEQFGIAVELTPGQTYEMLSTLTVFADGGLSGGARAFFDNTFTAEFGETLIPEPTSLMLLAFGACLPLLRRKNR
jgi:streptogramin lyase